MKFKMFKVLAGIHYDSEGVRIENGVAHLDGERKCKKGDTVISSYDLAKTFRNKFEFLGLTEDVTAPTSLPLKLAGKKKKSLPASTSKVKTKETNNVTEHPIFGLEVTSQFQELAAKAEMKVFKKDDNFIIVDTDDDVQLNKKKKLTKEEEVVKFLQKSIGE